MTRLHLTGDVAEFAAAAEDYLLSDPAAHTIALTVLAQLRAGIAISEQAPRFGWLTDRAGEVVAAASWTPPFPVSLATADPSYAAALAPGFLETDGVIGPTDAAYAFGAALGRPAVLRMSELLYRLDHLVVPPTPPGGPRPFAAETDLGLADEWFEAFEAETQVPPTPGPTRAAVASRLARGVIWFWSQAGRTVSMAGYVNAGGGVPRIGPVYTPPEHRGNGYAAALTAAVTQHALDHGALGVALFTDAANPTSNAVYRRIGFREVASIVDLRWGEDHGG